MKKITAFILLCFLCTIVNAQSSIETVSYLKTDQQAVVNEIPFPEKIIMSAIDNKMEQMGYKGKSTKGFTIYKGVRMAELGTGQYDLYFTADRMSRKNKENSTLTLIISTGNDVFANEKTNYGLMDKAKTYLDSIASMIKAYDLEQQITEQQNAVDKAGKKYNNLVDDGQSLEKKRKDVEKDIEDNKKDQEKQLTDIEKQKLILETLKSKRKQ